MGGAVLPSRRPGAALAWAGVAGVVVYVAIDVALAFLRPDYSLLRNAESDYGVGPWSWLMDVNFMLRGVTTAVIAAALARAVRPSPGLRAALALLLVWAAGSFCLAFFPDDPAGTPVTPSGRIHVLIALVIFVAVAVATPLAGFALRGERAWRGWTAPLITISVLAIIDLLLLGRRGSGARSYGGLYERIFLGLELLWLLAVALHLATSRAARAAAGAPGDGPAVPPRPAEGVAPGP